MPSADPTGRKQADNARCTIGVEPIQPLRRRRRLNALEYKIFHYARRLMTDATTIGPYLPIFYRWLGFLIGARRTGDVHRRGNNKRYCSDVSDESAYARGPHDFCSVFAPRCL